MSIERLEATLGSLAVAYPETPSLAAAVTGRLSAERAAGRRPPFPGAALWNRRRVIALVVVGLVAVLAIAAAARYAIGSFEIRVQPGVTPGPSTPALDPDVLGDPVAPDVAVALAGFEPALPQGPPPDQTFVIDTRFGDPGLLFAWWPSGSLPAIGGTDRGLILIAAQGEAEFVVKTIDRLEDMDEVRVDGRRAFWIPVPHLLTLETERGVANYAVEGNVLIWQGEDGVAYRLETSLGRTEAIALAESTS